MSGGDTEKGEANEREEARSDAVEFGALREVLREHQYPVSAAELIEVYGGFEFEGPGGVDRLEPALKRTEEKTFRSPVDVRDAVLAGLAAGEAYGDAPEGLAAAEDDWSRLSM